MSDTDWKSKHDSAMGLLGDAVEQMERFLLRDCIVRAGWHPYQGEGLQLHRILAEELEAGRIQTTTVDLVWRTAETHGFASPDWTPIFPTKENT
jgi:hypothetical protein